MISEPPISSGLIVKDKLAFWPTVWGSFFTEAWQAINYGWLWGTKTVTANYTCGLTDSVILLNGNVTVTLPLAREAGAKRITVKVINAGAGTRTVSGNGSNIDGAATVTTTTQYTSWDFVTNGVQWFTV